MQSLAKIEADQAAQAIVAAGAAAGPPGPRQPEAVVAVGAAAGVDFGFEGEDEEAAELVFHGQAFAPHDGDLAEDAPAPLADAAAPPPPPPPPPRAVHGPRPDNAVVLQGKPFVNLYDGRGDSRVRTGLSRQCNTCGYTRNIYHVSSGLSDDIAVRRLLAWEAACPGRHASQLHKELGLPKHAGRLMSRYG